MDSCNFAAGVFNLIINTSKYGNNRLKMAYYAPQAKVIEVKIQSVVCTSPGYPTEFEEENE